MTAQIIDGKAHAQLILDEVHMKALELAEQPGLAVIIVGNDPASHIYVNSKAKKAKALNFHSEVHSLPSSATERELLELIHQCNEDAKIHGILVQLPLPAHISPKNIIDAIDPKKDVDGFHPYNLGRLALRDPTILPCTPLGCLRLIKSVEPDLRGLHAVMVGASNIVGRPMGQLLLMHGCTVSQTHRFSKNTPELCQQADIIVAAAGKPGLVRGNWIKPGATIIDVGINRTTSGAIVGDVVFDEAKEVAKAITPVPGGVGPMTIACLMENTLRAAMNIEIQAVRAHIGI